MIRTPNDWWIDWPPQLRLPISKDILDDAIRYEDGKETVNAPTVGQPYYAFKAGHPSKYVVGEP